MPNNSNQIDIYEPRYLAEVVRTAPAISTFFRDTFFTNVKVFPTERVDIDIVKGDRRMAPFVHPRMGGKVIEGAGYSTESFAPPLINPADISTADQFMTRLPGEDLYSGMTPDERAAQQLPDDYNRLNDMATRREEWMAVQAIVNGSIPVVGEGVNAVIDFGLTNKMKLGTAKQWGKDGAKPLDDLEDWTDKVLINGFTNVDMAIMGKTALRNFLNDAGVQKMLDNRRITLGEIKPANLPNGVKYIGTLLKPNLEIYTYSEVYLDDWTDPEKPETKPHIPDNAVILIASHPNYMMAYGLNKYLDDTKTWHVAQNQRLLRTFVAHQPDRLMMELQTHPLPIPDKADSWLVAEVC